MGLLSTLLGHASDLTPEQTREDLDGILLPEESVEVAFKLIRDLFVFTDRRLTLLWQIRFVLLDRRSGPKGTSSTAARVEERD
ncbi:MAG: cytoplasmic protein, partial [Microvirga sp.]|nr:cytoplasmic protein [Microvirga sp.]